MKKITALIFALILTLGLVGCNGKKVNIDFPFEVEDVESVKCTTTTERLHRQKRK